MRLSLMPDAAESCHVARHGSSDVVSCLGWMVPIFWALLRSETAVFVLQVSHLTLSNARRGVEQMERKPILKDDGSRNLARLLSTSVAAKSSVSASA